MLLLDFLNPDKKTSLLSQATDTCREMLCIGHQMFHYSLRVLMDNEKEAQDIYASDRQLNHLEITVRRKVIEHLVLNPKHDVVPALFLAAIVGDIERIGDYCKNVVELAHHYPEKLEGPYIDRIREIEGNVTRVYEMTIKAFAEGDSELARAAMELNVSITRESDQLTDKLLAETAMPARDAVIRALLLRFLKRVGAHLKNVASSLVNPYPRIGYKPDGSPDDKDE
jgi:phosphate uptake regulator